MRASASKCISVMRRFLRDDQGPTAVEYAIMLALIVLVAAGSIAAIGQRMWDLYEVINAAVP